MNFIEAVKLLNRGYNITSKSWKQFDNILFIKYVEGYGVAINGEEDHIYDFDFSDYYDKEWEIYEEKPKLHTFEEALEALKNGAKIYRASRVKNDIDKKREAEASRFLFYNYEDFEAKDWIILED